MDYITTFKKAKNFNNFNKNLKSDGMHMSNKTYMPDSSSKMSKITFFMIMFFVLALILLFNGYISIGVLSLFCSFFIYFKYKKTKVQVIKNSLDEVKNE